MKACQGGRGSWTPAGSGFVPSPPGHLEGEAVSLLPSGIYLNIKGLSLELLWALDISTDMTFGFQWQFYGSLYSCDHNGGVQMAPLPVRRGKVVCWSEEDRKPHTLGPTPGLASHLLDAWNKSHKITGLPSFCVQINCLWQMLRANFKGN